jgi:membrane-bound inhibitor of C-type lysozyme
MEFYPERMQSLVSQMYAWKAPGTKYETAVIVQWLEGEDELVRDRINQVNSLKNNNSTIEETP